MAKYKVCPACAHQNDPKAVICTECDYDLVTVLATEVKTGNAEPERTQEARVGRQCTQCGNIYPLTAFRCTTCNLNLSAMPIVKMEELVQTEQAETHDGRWRLFVREQNTIFLEVGEGDRIVLGRNYELGSYLQDCRTNDGTTFVSGRHAELFVQNGKLYVRDANSTNGIQVNFESVPPTQEKELKENDLLSLGGKQSFQQKGAAYFCVQKV